MAEAKKSTLDWASLTLGILFIITSLLSFRNPVGNLAAIVAVFAIFAILKGIFEIFIRNKLKQLTGYKAYAPLVLGILNILLGVFFLFNLSVGIVALPFIFAIWFIVESIFGLFTLDAAKRFSKAYCLFAAIINVLGLILGLSLLFDPIASALTLSFMVGTYLLLLGLINIVYAFRKS